MRVACGRLTDHEKGATRICVTFHEVADALGIVDSLEFPYNILPGGEPTE